MKAFTLLEVLVVTVILAMIATMAQSSLFQASNAAERASARSEFHVALTRGLFILTKDLTNLSADAKGEAQPIQDFQTGFGNSSLDAVLFRTLLGKDPADDSPFSDNACVGYFVMKDPIGKVMTLFRWLKVPYDGSLEKGGTLDPLIPNVQSLNFWFFDGDAWKDTLPNPPNLGTNAPSQGANLPIAVAVEIRVKDPNTRSIATYRQVVPIPAGLQQGQAGDNKAQNGRPQQNQGASTSPPQGKTSP